MTRAYCECLESTIREREIKNERDLAQELQTGDETLVSKEEELESLKSMLERINPGEIEPVVTLSRVTTKPRRGKAPPVDVFSGESLDLLLDDWLPSLQRAADWNGWTEQEQLLQLAGHLRGRAFQEWNLLDGNEKDTLQKAVASLRGHLDPGSKALAAQDFRHTLQREGESVADFIRRLERTFRIAYGRESMSSDTRDTLLHGQLQEALRYELMRAPAVSGAQTYKEL